MKSQEPNNRKLFIFTKKTIATAVALATMATASFTIAANAPSTESVANAAMLQTKFIQAKGNNAIKGKYIVVLKSQEISEQVFAMTGQNNMSAASAMSYRQNVVASMAMEMTRTYGVDVEHQYHAAISGFSANMTRDDMQVLLADDRIEYIEEDQMMHANATQNNAIWGLDRIDQASLPLNSKYRHTADGSGVTAYIIDTGILNSHPDFNGRAKSGYDFVDKDNNTNDCNGHGTHVAGTVGSTTYGVAKKVTLVGVRVLNCAGSGSNAGVIAAVDWVARNANRPAVANMSLGGGKSRALNNAVQRAIKSGVAFAVAAGNENSNACNSSPASAPNALTVASSTRKDKRSGFSNWGSCVDLFAPGSSIKSTSYKGRTATLSGTSMAAPHVAGVAALFLQNNPDISVARLNALIIKNTVRGKIANVKKSPNRLLHTVAKKAPPSKDPSLVKGVPLTNLSGAARSTSAYSIKVPAGASNLSFKLSGGTGDADLYVKSGSAPTTASYDCRPFLNRNNERCNVPTPNAGTYHVMIRGYKAYKGASLVADYSADGASTDESEFSSTPYFIPIPDNNSTGAHTTIGVAREGVASNIEVSIHIIHPYIGDLVVELIAPDASVTTLHNRQGGSTDNIKKTFPLNMNNKTARGIWKLKVTDLGARDTGRMLQWKIRFK